MNPKISIQKRLKKRYGVTFTPEMPIKDMLEAWSRVPSYLMPGIPAQVKAAFTAAEIAYNIATGFRSTYVPLKKTYDTALETLDDATSAIYTVGAATTARTATVAPLVAEKAADKAVQDSPEAILGVLESQI